MKSFFLRNKQIFWLLFIFIICELIVNPLGNYPLNDDWTYGKSVMIFQEDGKVNIGDFPAMTLFSHMMWGFLFTKVFWFSFTVLRFSTLVASFIGIAFLYKLVLRITENKFLAFFLALILLFNPLYFNLTNTFMTDVSFNTLLILCCYFGYDFFKTQNRISFFLVFVFSLALVLVRQFGIIVPVCFTFSCLFLKEKRWLSIGFGLLLTIVVFAIFKYYEAFLKTNLPPNSSYKFSSDTHMFSLAFWDAFVYYFKLRYSQIILHLLVYTSPLILIYCVPIVKKIKIYISFLVVLITAYFVYTMFKEVPFPIGNIFTNRALGAETFFESLFSELKSPHEHTYSTTFETQATWVKYILCAINLSLLILVLINGIKQKVNILKIQPAVLFIFGLLFTYIFMIFITESYFDRYHIPIITVTLILISFLSDRSHLNYTASSIILVLLCYISVFGTKDYLELNRKRWEAYNYLKEVEKIDPVIINGGFEVNCWNEGKRSWWYNFFDLKKYDYLIQYRKEPKFIVHKVYEFQRYFPYKKDTIYIFKRDSLKAEESKVKSQ